MLESSIAIQFVCFGGARCVNYDDATRQQFDLVGEIVKDEILHDIDALEYVAASASPECSTFSKLQNLPAARLSRRRRDRKDKASRPTTSIRPKRCEFTC